MVETTELLNIAIRRWMEKNSEYLDVVQPLEDAVTEAPVQATFCGDIARMQEAQQALMNSGLWEQITVLRTQYEERDLCIVDVLNQGCSKGHALRRWAGHRGIERQQVMAIGDNYNDIEMLEFAGVPVIMANACDELKQNGWMVTLGNNQDGVALRRRVGAGMIHRRWPWLALLLCACCAHGAELARLTNGFNLRCERHEELGGLLVSTWTRKTKVSSRSRASAFPGTTP